MIEPGGRGKVFVPRYLATTGTKTWPSHPAARMNWLFETCSKKVLVLDVVQREVNCLSFD